jgi:CheY-like chemotaxis protein
MKIFLAEDNEDNYLVVKSNLRRLLTPVELVWAKDGQEAIEMLENEANIDLFLVDIEMPRVGGVELAKWIRSQPRFESAPIVAITASVFAEMKERYLDQGMDHILEKPFSRKDFLSMLERTVGLK